MTIEITEFRCPYCGHLLGEEEAKAAQQKKTSEIEEVVQQRLDKEISIEVGKKLNEEKILMQQKHNKELEEKDKQIEQARLQSNEGIDEKAQAKGCGS
jgi:hypothetical protein